MLDDTSQTRGARRSHVAVATLIGLAHLGATVAAQEEPTGPEPLRIGRTERVEVQFVLLDVFVLDRQGRTVPGLGIDDFRLRLDGRKIEIETLDVDCPVGEAADPAPGEALASGGSAPQAPVSPRKIVLAFDYFHIPWSVETVAFAKKALLEMQVGGEEHMVVSLGQTLRVEQKFTRDPEEVIAAMDRMLHDAALYAGHYERLTERRVFERMLALLDLMETIPGRKVVLLFTGPFISGGWTYDPYFKDLASMATATRTAIYPVDSRGLMPDFAPVPPFLARIAVETGGRLTSGTNDLSLAYARAQRDRGCTYTLGFYDDYPEVDRYRKVAIRMVPPRARAYHPNSYVLRSREEKVKSMAQTASMAPEMFDAGGLGSEAFVTLPAGTTKWEVMLALDVPREIAAGTPETGLWHLGGAVRKPSGTLLHRFDRRVRPEDALAEGGRGERLFYESLKLRPGPYVLSLYLYNEYMNEPLAALGRFVVPEVPRGEPFLVGPTIGRPVNGKTAAILSPVLPLPAAETSGDAALASLTRLCRVGKGKLPLRGQVDRFVASPGGRLIESYESLPIELEGSGRVRCQALVDRVTTPLEAGSYRFHVTSAGEGLPAGRAMQTFSVLEPE